MTMLATKTMPPQIKTLREIVDRMRDVGPDAAEFFEQSPALLGIVNSDNMVILRANRSWSRALNRKMEDIEMHAIAGLMHPNDIGRTVDSITNCSGRSVHVVNRLSRKGGGWSWVSWTMTPWSGEGLSYWTGIDVTSLVEEMQSGLALAVASSNLPEELKLALSACPDNTVTLFRSDGVSIVLAKMPPGTFVPLHAHSEKQIVGVYHGQVEFSVDGAELITLNAGDSIEIKPGHAHWAHAPSDAFIWTVTMPASNEFPYPPKELIDMLSRFVPGQ